MITYLNKSEEHNLQFIICGYQNEMIYHDYDDLKSKLSAGKSLTYETTKAIFNFVNEVDDIQNYFFKGIIPRNILKYKTDEKFVIWQTPGELKHIIYQEDLPIQSGTYWVPKMVWKLVGNNLKVWAVQKEVLKESEKLYNAPFFNISQDGSVCMGNAKFTDNSYDYSKIIKKVEEAFWDSKFTHTNNDRLLTVNFVEWCNNPVLRLENCNLLLVDSKETIKDIL